MKKKLKIILICVVVAIVLFYLGLFLTR